MPRKKILKGAKVPKALPKSAVGLIRQGFVVASILNVRSDPSTQKPPVGMLSRDKSVQILDQIGSWFRIRAGRVVGYVYGDYLTIVDPAPASGFFVDREDLKRTRVEPTTSQQMAERPDSLPREKLIVQTWNSVGGLLRKLCNVIEVDPGVAVAVMCIESGGQGFGPDGRMVIRFENHVFWKKWGTRNAEMFNIHFRFDPEERWKGHEFRGNATDPWVKFHGDQLMEWRVFEFARTLGEADAMRSISMGGPQIMGFNHARIGYDSVQVMYECFQTNLRYHILGLFDFIKGPGTTSSMVVALQRQKFFEFAASYNGSGKAAEYGEKIEAYFDTFRILQSR